MAENKYTRLISYLGKFLTHSGKITETFGIAFVPAHEQFRAIELIKQLIQEGEPPTKPEPKKRKQKTKSKHKPAAVLRIVPKRAVSTPGSSGPGSKPLASVKEN